MSKQHTTVSADEAVAMFDLNLKNRGLAALLAWLVPGLGHLYQGRTAKGLLFMICLVSTFAFGYYLGGGRVVYAGTEPLAIPGESFSGRIGRVVMTHWRFAFQSGMGGVAIPCVIERERAIDGKAPLLGEWVRPPEMNYAKGPFTHEDNDGNTVRHPNELAKWQYLGGFNFELGGIYTAIAGLLNVLVVFDAFSGPLIVRPKESEEKKPGGDPPNDSDSALPDSDG